MHSGHKGPNREDWTITDFVFPHYTVEIPPFWTAESLHHCTSGMWLSQYTFSVSLCLQDGLNPVSSAGRGLLPPLESSWIVRVPGRIQYCPMEFLKESVRDFTLEGERSKRMTALRTLLGMGQIKIYVCLKYSSAKDCHF